MFGPWLSQLGLIITALVHMKKYARISYSFVCRPSLPWTKLDHHRRPMAEDRTQHSARETTEPIIFSEAQNGIKHLFHIPHLFARGYCLLSLWKFVISVWSRQIRAGKHTKSPCEKVVQIPRRLWSDWTDAHADLNLRGTHACVIFDLSYSRSYLRFVLRAQDILEY